MAGHIVGLYPNPPDNMAGFYPTIGGVPIGNKTPKINSARRNSIRDNGLYPIVQSIALILPHIGTRVAIVPYRLFDNSGRRDGQTGRTITRQSVRNPSRGYRPGNNPPYRFNEYANTLAQLIVGQPYPN